MEGFSEVTYPYYLDLFLFALGVLFFYFAVFVESLYVTLYLVLTLHFHFFLFLFLCILLFMFW